MATTHRAPTPAADAAPDQATRLRLYRTMVECRLFETRAQELFFEGLVRGTTHLGVGQEAVAAGFAVAMRDDDYTFATYRGHNHALARGTAMGPLYAELFGRASGLLGGKGGSMHITDVAHHMMGSYAIVGAHLPIALGAAWSAQYRKSGQVAVCFFGDGTTNIGTAAPDCRNFTRAEGNLIHLRLTTGPTFRSTLSGYGRSAPVFQLAEIAYFLAVAVAAAGVTTRTGSPSDRPSGGLSITRSSRSSPVAISTT